MKHANSLVNLPVVPTARKRLTNFRLPAPGQLLKLGKTPAEEMFVKWTKSLNVSRSTSDPSIQTLVLKGDTRVEFQETSSIDAQRIDMKLKRLEQNVNGSKGATEFAVMEIVATEDVHISTPEITGKTDRLIAEFPKPLKLKSHQVGRPRYQVNNGFQIVTGFQDATGFQDVNRISRRQRIQDVPQSTASTLSAAKANYSLPRNSNASNTSRAARIQIASETPTRNSTSSNARARTSFANQAVAKPVSKKTSKF